MIKISIPDAQGTSVDNRVSRVSRTTDPQSSLGSVYYTFSSAEKRH